MSSNTASADTPTCLTLIGPSKFQITAKLQREKDLGMALGTDTCPITSLSIPATVEEIRKWMEWNERAHRINDTLLLKMEMHTTAQELFDALLSIHQASNLTSAFYIFIFQQLFNSAWSGGSTISKHITLLWTMEACLARMK
ncbi:hypothetical protein PAXRUDRAFT_156801, partial [Paxillus rubicundulus Ve08.2h10]